MELVAAGECGVIESDRHGLQTFANVRIRINACDACENYPTNLPISLSFCPHELENVAHPYGRRWKLMQVHHLTSFLSWFSRAMLKGFEMITCQPSNFAAICVRKKRLRSETTTTKHHDMH